MKPAKREQDTAWEMRTAWGSHKEVRLTLTGRCTLRTIVGHVSAVSVTGAFVTVDGWHVPTVEILGTGRPTIADRDAYTAEMARLRSERLFEEAA